jgi:hypothetical protein
MATVPCLCPPTAEGVRHPEGDTVTLRDPLDFRTAVTMQKAVTILFSDQPGASPEQVLGVLSEAYVVHGVASWSVVDGKGKPVPVNPATVAATLLPHVAAAMAVADEADPLYAKAVLVPLLAKASNSSPGTPTSESTSPATGSPPAPLKPLRPSSTSTTPTADTATTSRSRAGGSSSSPSSASAA